MTIEEVLSAEETQIFDRKSIHIDPKALAIPIIAFANADGGTVAIGISDKTRRVEGIDDETGKHALRHQAQHPREGDGQEKHLYGPTEPGERLLLSAAARLFSLQIKLPPKKVLLIRMDFPKSTDNRYAWGSC